MFKVTRVIHFSYGHRLLNYKGKCKNLHGHNARVEIDISSKRLNDKSMVKDFNELKKTLQKWIENNLDHKMVLRKDDPALVILKKLGQPCFTIKENPTAEIFAKLIFQKAKKEGLPVSSVRFWETDKSCATYRPQV